MQPSRRGYRKANIDALMRGLKITINGWYKPALVKILATKARQVVDYIDKQADIPRYLGHLHDATGVGVYVDGKVSSYLPTKKAKKLGKSGVNGVNHYGIDGHEFLANAIADAQSRFSQGIWFVLFSAVPYAWYINAHGSPIGRGQNFFTALENMTAETLLSQMRVLDPNTSSSISNL